MAGGPFYLGEVGTAFSDVEERFGPTPPSTYYVYTTEQETKARLQAGLVRDAAMVARKKAQIKENQELYEKQLEFNAKMEEIDLKGSK